MKCSKKSFESLESANKRIAEIWFEENISDRKPIRSYECPYCGKYHISSINDSEFNKYKEFIKAKERKWIEREGRYWNRKFGLDE